VHDTPNLAELLASMTVLDAPERARRDRQHIRDAIAVLDAALAQPVSALGRSHAGLDRRRAWLQARLDTPERPTTVRPLNRRPVSAATLGRPPEDTGAAQG
jgi:hypothetical protein